VTTRVFDVALGYGWPPRFAERVLRNRFWEEWADREDVLATDEQGRATLAEAVAAGDYRVAHVDAGQGVGLVTEERPAADVVQWLCAGASELLGSWSPPGGGAG
jgi:nitronate monooxygenase